MLSRLPRQEIEAFFLNRGLNTREVRDHASGTPLGYEAEANAVDTGDATRYTIEGDVGAGERTRRMAAAVKRE